MGFIDHIKELARKDKKTIILPENVNGRKNICSNRDYLKRGYC